MSYAVKMGTLEATWIDQQETPLGHVRYGGEIVEGDMVWDDALQNIRRKNQAELDAEAATKAALDTLFVQLGIDKADLAAQYAAGMTLLDNIAAATILATFSNNTQRDAAIQQIAAAVKNLATIQRRMLKVVRALVI